MIADQDRKKSNLFGFTPTFFNLAETTRLLHIAQEVQRRAGDVVFFSHGGQFEHLVRDQDLTIVPVEPRYSRELVQHLMQVSRLEKREVLTLHQIRAHVASEVPAYQAQPLRALITGFNFTSSISARAAGVPLVWFVQAPSTLEYYEQGLASLPEMFYHPLLDLIPRRLLDLLLKAAAHLPIMVGSFNRVAREYSVPRFPNLLSVLRGELTLVGDHLEFTPLKPAERLPRENFVGPILPAVKGKIEPEVAAHIEAGRSGGRRPVFFAMGTSGQPDLFLSIIHYLDRRRDLQSVVAYTEILPPEQLPAVGKHVLLRRLVLAEEVARRVDLSIIHGGHSTMYTQAYSGTPFVGIPMQPEQQDNLEALARRGCGIWISKSRYREEHLNDAVERIFDSYEQYKQAAVALRDSLPPPRGAERSANLIMRL